MPITRDRLGRFSGNGQTDHQIRVERNSAAKNIRSLRKDLKKYKTDRKSQYNTPGHNKTLDVIIKNHSELIHKMRQRFK